MPAADTASFRLRLFGPLQVERDGQPLPRLRSRKGHWLLALLVLRHGREVERVWLAGTLWPDSPASQEAYLRALETWAEKPRADRIRSLEGRGIIRMREDLADASPVRCDHQRSRRDPSPGLAGIPGTAARRR